MNDLPKKPFNQKQPSSPDYLIPVKNINAFIFSEPDVGYINGKIEDCDNNAEDIMVSLDLVRYRHPVRNEYVTRQSENPEPPLFDISLHSSADTPPGQKDHNTTKHTPRINRFDTHLAPQQHHSLQKTDPSTNSEKINDSGIIKNKSLFNYPDPSEVETYTDLSTLANDSRPIPSGETSVYFSNSFKTVPHQEPRKPEGSPLEDLHLTLDETLERIVCSDPFLSEKDLFILLQQEYHGTFKLSRRSLKKQLVKNGLDNGYKRFRAYIAG